MEAAEALDDATPPLMEGEGADDVEIITLDDSDVQILEEGGDPEESQDAPMPGETEAGREVVEAVIDHAGPSGIEESAMEETTAIEEPSPMEETAPIEDPTPIEDMREETAEEQAEMEEGSTTDTLPMYDEVDEPPLVETAEASEGTTTTAADAEVKDESQPIEDESSQPVPEAGESTEAPQGEQFVPSNLPATFPHCFVCGFDRETVFKREKKASSGPHKGKLIYKNRCVRKACLRFFGPSYVWDGRAAEYAKVADESGTASRPYTNGPKTTKMFPASDYEKAGPSGVMPPQETNGAWSRAMSSTTGNPAEDATSASGFDSTASASGSPAMLRPPPPPTLAAKSSSSSRLSPMAAAAGAAPAPARKAASTAPKKPRKGYQWVAEDELQPPQPARPDPVVELARLYAAQNAMEKAAIKASISSRTFGTQTGDEEQVVATLVDEMRTKAVFPSLQPNADAPMTPSAVLSFSNRLFITQRTLKMQMAEIKNLRAERDLLKQNFKTILGLLEEYKKTLLIDITRLKEDVVVANKEIKNFALELQNEARKDIKEITKIKEHVAKRLDDSDRYRRKVEASLHFQQSVTAEAETIADNYHRHMVELEKKIIVCRIEEEDAKSKLNDAIYLTNNAKCGNCQVSERIKKMLTEQLGDKTLSANNLGKEREELAKKLENQVRIANIMGKQNEQLKFEKAAWESNCHRFRSELIQLRGSNAQGLVHTSSLPSSTPTSVAPGEAAFTPQSTTTKDADEVTPERMDDDVIEVDRPPPTISTASSAEDGEYQSPGQSPNTLARLPPPPLPPTIQLQQQHQKEPSPDHAPGFANWIPKDKKVQEMPPEMAEAMRKVAESLERGPPPKEKGGPPKKKEKRDEKRPGGGSGGGKRSGEPHQFAHSHNNKNGEKKPKLDGGSRREEKVTRHHPPPPPQQPRPIPTLGSKGGFTPVPPTKKEKRREERIREPSPVPFSSAHEPAFPAVVIPKKPAVKVPYNGPSMLVAGGGGSSGSGNNSKPTFSTSSPLPPMKNNNNKGGGGAGGPGGGKTPEKKKPLNFLPVAGSLAMPSHLLNPRVEPSSSRPVTVESLLREAERLREIERDRDHRDQPYPAASPAPAPDRRAVIQPPMRGGGAPAGGFAGGFDDDLPWNAGRAPNYQQPPARPRTPVQDWYYDEPLAGHAPPPQQQQRPPSPGRYFDDMYNPHARRDQYGRLEPDFGMARHPHQPGPSHPHLHPHHLLPPHPGHRGAPPPQGLPPPHHQAPPPHEEWRREWHGQQQPPPRRNYWD